jgi:hypothetical protein
MKLAFSEVRNYVLRSKHGKMDAVQAGQVTVLLGWGQEHLFKVTAGHIRLFEVFLAVERR